MLHAVVSLQSYLYNATKGKWGTVLMGQTAAAPQSDTEKSDAPKVVIGREALVAADQALKSKVSAFATRVQ